MSTYNFVATARSGVNIGAPGGIADLVLPFDWALTGRAGDHPVAMTFETRNRMYVTPYRLGCIVEIDEAQRDEDGDIIDTNSWSFNFELTRSTNDELGLLTPGIDQTHGIGGSPGTAFRYSGSQTFVDFPEDGNEVSCGVLLGIFDKRLVGNDLATQVQIPHMVYANGLWYPSILLEIGVTVDAGSEYSHQGRSYSDPDETAPIDVNALASVLDGSGGGDVAVAWRSDRGGGPIITNASVTIYLIEAFSWNGNINPATGLPVA